MFVLDIDLLNAKKTIEIKRVLQELSDYENWVVDLDNLSVYEKREYINSARKNTNDYIVEVNKLVNDLINMETFSEFEKIRSSYIFKLLNLFIQFKGE